MTKNAEYIKAALMVELEKQGSTLEQFEKQLLEKQANALINPSELGTSALNIAKGLLNLGGLTAVGTGAALGYGGYKAYNAVSDSEAQMAKRIREKKQYEDAMRSLISAQKNQAAAF